MKLVTLALSLCSASAFVQKSASPAGSALDACISKSEVLKSPNTIEVGKVWDPLGLAEIGSDETVAWFRHSEIKHGRVAMAAVRNNALAAVLSQLVKSLGIFSQKRQYPFLFFLLL